MCVEEFGKRNQICMSETSQALISAGLSLDIPSAKSPIHSLLQIKEN